MLRAMLQGMGVVPHAPVKAALFLMSALVMRQFLLLLVIPTAIPWMLVLQAMLVVSFMILSILQAQALVLLKVTCGNAMAFVVLPSVAVIMPLRLLPSRNRNLLLARVAGWLESAPVKSSRITVVLVLQEPLNLRVLPWMLVERALLLPLAMMTAMDPGFVAMVEMLVGRREALLEMAQEHAFVVLKTRLLKVKPLPVLPAVAEIMPFRVLPSRKSNLLMPRLWLARAPRLERSLPLHIAMGEMEHAPATSSALEPAMVLLQAGAQLVGMPVLSMSYMSLLMFVGIMMLVPQLMVVLSIMAPQSPLLCRRLMARELGCMALLI